MDSFLQFGLSNLYVSLLLALAAWLVQSRGKNPLLAHMLWLLVLVKLLTPPMFNFSVDYLPSIGPSQAEAISLDPYHFLGAEGVADTASPELVAVSRGGEPTSWIPMSWQVGNTLGAIWLLGSLVVLVWSLIRIARFHHLLMVSTVAAQPRHRQLAVEASSRLGIKRIPELLTTSARISPLVWWAGGRVRIILPQSVIQQLDDEQLRLIIAHELAHVSRRDHQVRWLEWLVCVCLWWNPVAWWARRNLRINEEVCCDALVLASMNPDRHCYANSLLAVVESLMTPGIRPPAIASELNSGGVLEKGFKMIVSNTSIPKATRGLRAVALICAAVLLPVGVAGANDVGESAAPSSSALMQEPGDKVEKSEHDQQSEKSEQSEQSEQSERSQDMDSTAISKEDYEKAAIELKELVAAGKISEKDAQRRLERMRLAMELQDEANRQRKTRQEYARVEAELKKMVEAGKISDKDAKARLAEMRSALEAQARAKEAQSRAMEQRKIREDYARVEAELKKMVEAGKISQKDAETRLAEMRRALEEQSKAMRQRKTRADYARVEAELKKLVDAGKISEEDAQRRLDGMRNAMSERSKVRDHQMSREEYERGVVEIKKLVEAGKISEEDARKRMARMREMVGDSKKTKTSTITTEEYLEIEAKVKAKVEAGEMSSDDATKTLERYRRMIGEPEADEREHKEDHHKDSGEDSH